MTTRDRLHRLVDELPEGDITDAAERLLEDLRDHGNDPLARKLLSAPIDDELDSAEERSTASDARRHMIGRAVSHQSMLAEIERRGNE
jgi:hypothetical protein